MNKSSKVTKTINSYFTLVAESLDFFNWPYLPSNLTNETQGVIDSFSNPPSILKIKQKLQINRKFSFK